MSERELTQSPWVHNTGGVGTVSNGGGGRRGEEVWVGDKWKDQVCATY